MKKNDPLLSFRAAILRVLPILFFLSGMISNEAQANFKITGAGATFPYPLYLKWMSEFQKNHPTYEMNYQSVGSGAGIKQILKKVIQYGASDSPMKEEQLKEAKEKIFHFPTVLGAVAITYHLKSVTEPLNFTPQVLVDLLFGRIYFWDDERIKKINPGISLPHLPTMVVYRADGSGTTSVFTDYLSKISPEWKEKVGSGTSIKWPVGIGGKGNEGVTGFIKNFEGSIGYVEQLYAEKNKLPLAKLQNKEGSFVAPSQQSIRSAVESFLESIPEDFRISITNAPGKDSYPIASFTYLLIYEKNKKELQEGLKKYLNWIYEAGESFAKELYYVPLPPSLLNRVKIQIKALKSENGEFIQ